MRRFLNFWTRCQRGHAATEFALIAPILIIVHLGSIELVQAWEANRRATHVASALADLVTQNPSVTTADLTDIFQAGPILMQPFPPANLGERISSFTANSSGTVSMDWSVTSNWTLPGAPSVPAGYLAANESVIVADVSYASTSLFGLVLPPTFTLQKHAYLRPRLSQQVTMG